MAGPNEIDKAVLVVTKKMCAKVFPVVKPGDKILVDLKFRHPAKGQFILISDNEEQWIEKYSRKLKDVNYYPIIRVIMVV
ncbi:MAG: hypothetical protein P4L45_05890 [Ignavibacteriaceae bacterium]|nr:hypothetical protein [Ignavibacteriaceae bacterium]